MIALVLCIVAFGASRWAGKRSLGQGVVAVLAVGYFYGILRANLLTTFSHFIFDASLMGFYLSQKWSSPDAETTRRGEGIWLWTVVLIGWPVLMVLMPFQPILISIVGLRGAVLFIPAMVLAARLKHRDLIEISHGLAALNVIAMAFAVAEYLTDVTRFFPQSPVTRIIYLSGDVSGGYFRIPAIFSSAHAYGGTMVGTIAYLIGLWEYSKTRKSRWLALIGIGAAFVGILMSATRLNFILGSLLILATLLGSRMKARMRMVFVLLIVGIAGLAVTNTRFQRFKSLGETDTVTGRIAGSVNRDFWEILLDYPMGNGLGGGGTSIPYFLEGQVKNPIGLENDWARILCEQGVIGLLLWVCFVIWFLGRAGTAFARGPWVNSRRLAWLYAVLSLGTGCIGLGLFTAIPGTVLLVLGMGGTSAPMPAEAAQPNRLRTAVRPQKRYRATEGGWAPAVRPSD